MPLKVGDPAPQFEAQTSGGHAISLSEYRGRAVWLVLFRYAACPFCARRVHELIECHSRIQSAGLNVLAVFPSPPHRIEKYVATYRPPFPTISDPKEDLYNKYHATKSAMGALRSAARLGRLASTLKFAPNSPLAVDNSPFRIPAEFLIDASQRIARAYYGSEIDDGIPIDEALELAPSLAGGVAR